MNAINTKRRILALIREAEEQFAGTSKALLDIEDYVAEYLTANGVIVPPCKVGDVVYALLYDVYPVKRLFVSEEVVTDVSKKGFWLSACYPAEDDHGIFCKWEEIGTEIFLSREEAEKAVKGANDERKAD